MDLVNSTNNKFTFKENITKGQMFSENFLASVLSVSLRNLRKTASLLRNEGEIMIYGDEYEREFKLEDVYIILTKYTKKEQVKVLEQFKMEFFRD